MNRIQSLNGIWKVRLSQDATEETPVTVPGRLADVMPEVFEPVWYRKAFERALDVSAGHRVLLEMDRVDMRAMVYLNGELLCVHHHAEEPFYMDVTDRLKDHNLLAVRVSAPSAGHGDVDGMTLAHSPNGGNALAYYTSVNSMGIKGDVRLRCVPAARIEDVHLLPDLHSGRVEIQMDLTSDVSRTGTLQMLLSEHGTGAYCAEDITQVDLAPGASSQTVTLTVLHPHLWNPEDPFLYDVQIVMTTSAGVSRWQGRAGFRELKVENGFFFLNGKRILVRSAHADPFAPVGSLSILAAAKTMGFNMLRYLTILPGRELLDHADEMGMMIYAECLTSWGMSDYPGMEADFYAYNDNMAHQCRNHPSVVLYGLFNEMPGANPNFRSSLIPETSRLFETGVGYLSHLRALDPARLVLLSSGRWDARGDVGSYSNPFSSVWEQGWGQEGKEITSHSDDRIMPYVPGMGDNHVYPTVPMDPFTRNFLRTMGKDGGPVFLSEMGYGCQTNLVRMARELSERFSPEYPYAVRYRNQTRRLSEFLDKYRLRDLFPFEEDFLLASIDKNAMQRRRTFDLIRANPSLCGYSMTSFSTGHEGVFYAAGLPMPDMTATLKECWMPLRWSVFVEEGCLYAGKSFEVEAVLCNEDVLTPGAYWARFAVTGPRGRVWSEEKILILPETGINGLPPLAVPALKATLPGLPAGAYTFAAELFAGEMPSGGRIDFTIEEGVSRKALPERIAAWALPENVRAILSQNGVEIADFRAESLPAILVGIPDMVEKTKENFDRLFDQVRQGARVIFLHPFAYDATGLDEQSGYMNTVSSVEGAQTGLLPFAPCGHRSHYRNWLYHVDNYANGEGPLEDVTGRGLVDYEHMGCLYPEYILQDLPAPDHTLCASFGSDLIVEDGTLSGLTLGEYRLGAGTVVLNAFRICTAAGQHPLADRLLLNLIAE